MSERRLHLIDNTELSIGDDRRERWNTPAHRRRHFHRLHEVVRYGFSLRAPRVLQLTHDIDRRIGDRDDVRKLTGTNHFSAMVVVKDDTLVFEKYASDFSPSSAHSVMSISKTMTHLIVGRLVDEGLIDLDARVDRYLPEIGSGYAAARVQDVLDMNIVNDYDEDYANPDTAALRHEAAMGWRLPPKGSQEQTNREFLCDILSDDLTNSSGEPQYKSANTDVLGWIAECVSGRDLRSFLVEIVEAAGIEHTFHLSTDRGGVPNLNGGVCMSARDLARYGLIFIRGGMGVNGLKVGSAAFIEAARACTGTRYPPPETHLYYANQLRTDGRWIGHGGWGGQFLFVDPPSGVVVVFFSVLENDSASDWAYQMEIIQMAQAIAALSPRSP